MGSELRREVAVLNRATEFFTEKGLTARMGGGPELWPLVLVKELIDNGLDAAEGLRPPCVEVTVRGDGLTVADNGPGLPEAVIRGSLDYNVRVSDKSLYVTPTRGQLGNALQCLWAAPFVAHGDGAAGVTVLAGGKRHAVRFKADQISGELRVEYDVKGRPVKTGTSVAVAWPGLVASYRADEDGPDFYRLVQGFAALNPHASFRYNGKAVGLGATATAWKKWLPTERPPPHWYDLDRFRGLVAGKLAAARKEDRRPQTLRDFIAENFCGLTGTVVRGEVLCDCGLEYHTLEDLARGDGLDDGKLRALLAAMQKHARPVQAKKLGLLGKSHLSATLVNLFGAEEGTVRYRPAVLEVGGLPYVLEVAFGYHMRDRPRTVITGVNWSPTLQPRFASLDWLLEERWVGEDDPCVLIAHLACPRPEFTDPGKTALSLPKELGQALQEGVMKTCSAWSRLRQKAYRREDRRERLAQRLIAESLRCDKAGFLSIKDACLKVIEQGYREASGGGSQPANARQIMYAVRRLVLQQKLTDPESGKDGFFKNSSSFTQGVLPDFLDKNPAKTADWDVAFDDRGHFAEPHTGERIGLGTLAVRDYIRSWAPDVAKGLPAVSLRPEVDTRGPAYRYRFALFIEKEGFNDLLANAQVQERYDIGLMSTKGMSVTAARQLVEETSREGVTVLVLHDFDQSGVSILHTLRSDTRRYKYEEAPKVIDIGFRLADVERLGLSGELITYRTKVDPRKNLRRSGASAAECDFLVSGGHPGHWEGRRVELNEPTAPQFLAFLEAKLAAAGARKVVPDGEALAAAYRLQHKKARLQQVIDAALEGIDDADVKVPAGLGKRLAKMIDGTPVPWDRALWDIVKETLDAGKAKGKGKR
jgi:DNA topoisomerase VI subunit B